MYTIFTLGKYTWVLRMKKQKDKFINGKEAIYLLLITKGVRNVGDITQALYGYRRNAKVPGWIGQLQKARWIKEDLSKRIHRNEHYYVATVKGFYDSIKKCLHEQNIKLNASEDKKLRSYLSTYFTIFIIDEYKNIDFNNNEDAQCISMSFIIDIITNLAIWNHNLYHFMKNTLNLDPFSEQSMQMMIKNRKPDRKIMMMMLLGPELVEKLAHLSGMRGALMNALLEEYNEKIKQILSPVLFKKRGG